MQRLKYPLMVLALLALCGAGLWFYKPHAGACEQRVPSEEPELARRGEELLDTLRRSAARFEEQGTAAARSVPTAVSTMAQLRETLLPLLDAPPRLTAVWKADMYLNLHPSQAQVLLCAVRPPFADTLKIPGDVRDAALLLYEVGPQPMRMRIALQLHREDDVYRWQALWVQPLEHRGRAAEAFESKADLLRDQGKDLDAALAYSAAQKLSYIGSNVETATHSRISQKAAAANSASNLQRLLSRDKIPREHGYLELSINSTLEQGLIPLVSFVSSKRNEDTRPEAHAIYEALIQQAPSFREDYAGVAFKAFPELPVAGKSYPTFGTVIEPK